MAFKPLRDLVLIRPRAQTNMSLGGIFIPESGQERAQEGEVVAVGPGKLGKKNEFIPTVTEVGTRVLFGKTVGMKIKLEGEDMLIMGETEIIGVLR